MFAIDLSLEPFGGLIMWPLLGLSLIGLILFFERTLYLHKGQIKGREFLAGVKNLLRKRRLVEALTLCEETPGPVANVVRAALLNYNQNEPRMRTAIQAAALVEIPLIERRIATLAAIARTAPMIGLLGTVLGLIEAFRAMEAAGAYGHAGLLSAGFGQALTTTAAGLAISAMAYLSHHFLSGRVRAIVHDMEWIGNEMMVFLLRDLPEEEEQSQRTSEGIPPGGFDEDPSGPEWVEMSGPTHDREEAFRSSENASTRESPRP